MLRYLHNNIIYFLDTFYVNHSETFNHSQNLCYTISYDISK